MKEVVRIKKDDKSITAEMHSIGTRILLLEDEFVEKRLLDSFNIDSYNADSKNTLEIDDEEVNVLINTRINGREIYLVYDKVNKRLIYGNGVNDVNVSYRLNLPYKIKGVIYGATMHETSNTLTYDIESKFVGIDIDENKFNSVDLLYLDLPGIGDKNAIIDIRKTIGELSYKISPGLALFLKVDGDAIKNLIESNISTYLLASSSTNKVDIYNAKLTDKPDYIYLPIVL